MQTKSIVVTGAAGFIGSCLVSALNKDGYNNLILVDDFSKKEKLPNLEGKKFASKIDREEFPKWLTQNGNTIDCILHMGARTDTTEFSWEILEKLNLNYTKELWEQCVKFNIPFIYASSAATYGSGEFGYDDNIELIEKLQPLNPYGKSKNEFDKWALKQTQKPIFWAGLKFFNVYGPNEYHKDRMASVVFHTFNQVNTSGQMNLFRSHRSEFKDGMQLRDFIYVKDVVEVILFLMKNQPKSDIYNLGTGTAESFLELAQRTFQAMQKPENISFVDIPEDIREKYQYFTEANMNKLKSVGYNKPFRNLKEGVTDYVSNYLVPKRHY